MLHLATCSRIYRDFWKVLIDLMEAVGIPYTRGDETARAAFLIFDRHGDRLTCREGAAILAIGWRCLYAAITKARVENTRLRLDHAVKRAVAMIISRVRAYGERWSLWYRRTRHTKNHKFVPLKHRKYKLTQCNPMAEHTISPVLLRLHSNLP